MVSRTDALREWNRLLQTKQNVEPIRFALSGDGSDATTLDVDGRPGWAWIRYDEEPNKVSQVRNRRFPGMPQDVPLIIGKEFASDKYVQVLGINWPLYDMFVNNNALISYLVPAHGDSHHAGLGSDPAYIDVRNILNGRLRPTDPATMTVQIESFAYQSGDTRALFGGGGVDMTYDIAGITNYQRYVMVVLDVTTGRLRLVKGLEVPAAVPADIPDVPFQTIPLGVVLTYYGQTEITEDDCYDYRILFHQVGRPKEYENLIQWIHQMDIIWTAHQTGVY